MGAGKLDKRVSLQRRKAGGKFGHPSDEWELVATVWANVRQLGGRERTELAVQAEMTHTVLVRYHTSLIPPNVAAHRLIYKTPVGEKKLNIKSARDLEEKREFIVYDCVEVI